METKNNFPSSGPRPASGGYDRGRGRGGKKKYRTNREIRAREVLVIDAEGQSLGVLNTIDALKRASAEGLDLVEISPFSTPPVCKIVDYGRMMYNEQKKQAEAKRNQKTVDLKEVQFSPTIGQNDFDVKVARIRKFIESGDKVKISLRFRGREITHKEVGLRVIEKIREQLDGLIKVEKEPKFEGKHLTMNIAAK